jgi:hypothetical protein
MTNLPIAAAIPRAGSPISNVQRSLEGSIPGALLRFAAPSLLQIVVQSAIAIVEIFLLSRLGTDALAGISALFPIVTLFVAITTVGIGGAVSSAVARSLGAGNVTEAEAIAMHAIMLSLILGAISAAILIFFGSEIYGALGATGEALNQALSYSNIVFGGSISLWLLGGLTAIVRGTGDMKTPAQIAIFRAAVALPLFGLLIFGWGPIPGFKIVGAAAVMLTYYTLGVIGLLVHLQSNKSPIHLSLAGFRPRSRYFARILGVASLSSVQILVTNGALIAITAYAARFGVEALAGYGLASRLELFDLFHGARSERRYDDNGWHLCRCWQRCSGASHYIHLLWAGGGHFCGGRAHCCAFGAIDRGGLYACQARCNCGVRLFPRDGIHLRPHGGIYGFIFRLSGLGARNRSVAGKPAQTGYHIDRRLDVAAATVGPARLALCAGGGFHGYRSVNSGHHFYTLAAKSTQWRAFRLKRRPAFITEGLHPLQFSRGISLEFDCRASTKDRRSSRILEQ